MQRITDINTTLLSKDKSWRSSLQTAVTPQRQANNPLSIIGEGPAFIVDVVNQKKTPVYSDDKNTIVLDSHVVTEEERRANELKSLIPLAISNMLDPWKNTSDPYAKLLFSKSEFLRSSKELASFLNEYTEKFGADAEFLERCNSLLDDLKKKDPNGENKINSHIQDLLKKAMRGQKVPVDQEKAEVLFNDAISEQLSKIHMIKFEDIMRASNF